MPDDGDALSFHVSTENLNAATSRLLSLGGLGRYPQAYHVLVLERSRRELHFDRRLLSGLVEGPCKCSEDACRSHSVNLGALGRPFGLMIRSPTGAHR
jgi:hypothetical protein